jgi:hypothetical protein
MKYKQCVLKKKIETGELIDVCWIPEKFAVKDKILRIKEDDGWIVSFVDKKSIEETENSVSSWEYTQHRNKTDVEMAEIIKQNRKKVK